MPTIFTAQDNCDEQYSHIFRYLSSFLIIIGYVISSILFKDKNQSSTNEEVTTTKETQEESKNIEVQPLQRSPVFRSKIRRYQHQKSVPGAYRIVSTTNKTIDSIRVKKQVKMKNEKGENQSCYLIKCKTKTASWFIYKTMDSLKEFGESICDALPSSPSFPKFRFAFSVNQKIHELNYYFRKVISFLKTKSLQFPHSIFGTILFSVFGPSKDVEDTNVQINTEAPIKTNQPYLNSRWYHILDD